MINHKDNPAEIFLVPIFDDDVDHAWCDTPAPGEGMKEEDATRYVRADLVPESNSVLAERIADLTRVNSGLVAQVEMLRTRLDDLLEDMQLSLELSEHDCDIWKGRIRDTLAATPAQCLAEIKAQAVEGAIAYGKERSKDDGFFTIAPEDLQECANQLRQAAKAGE